jgi:tungstate transport system substrate-binding protein
LSLTRFGFALVLASLAFVLVACTGDKDGERKDLILGATSSLRDSGLLAELEPAFEKAHPDLDLVVIANGTGAAMKNAERGLVDLLLVHSPARERAFVAAGHGLDRQPLMESSFLIVGPAADPAKIRGLGPGDALLRMARGGHRFVSRGDSSGTHDRENKLWKAAEGRPDWNNYIESGRGMGATLTMAYQMEAYTLVDSGTFANFAPKIDLVSLVEGDALLANPYHVIALPRERRKNGADDRADRLATWLQGEEAQGIIRDFRINDMSIFRPGVSPR